MMLKKIGFVGFLIVGMLSLCFGEPSGRGFQLQADIGPTVSASTDTVTLSAAGTNRKNCITDIVAISTGTFTFRILDGNTTDYQLLIASNTQSTDNRTIDTAICGSNNTDMLLKMTFDNDGVSSASLNYFGFVR